MNEHALDVRASTVSRKKQINHRFIRSIYKRMNCGSPQVSQQGNHGKRATFTPHIHSSKRATTAADSINQRRIKTGGWSIV